jgi:hypothetical protein
MHRVTTASARHPAIAGRRDSPPQLDYYVICAPASEGGGRGEPEGILAEEFLLADDHSAAGLVGAGWSSLDRHWRNASDTSRRVRADAALRSRVVPVSRSAAADLYRDLGGGDLPDETTLRTTFADAPVEPVPAPLRLGRPEVAPGFHETRIYRILFANDLGTDGLAAVRESWQMTCTDPGAAVVGTARRRISGDLFVWDLRRIGGVGAWCLDVTVNLAGSDDEAVGLVLRGLTTQMRAQGLIPVTIDRFS